MNIMIQKGFRINAYYLKIIVHKLQGTTQNACEERKWEKKTGKCTFVRDLWAY